MNPRRGFAPLKRRVSTHVRGSVPWIRIFPVSSQRRRRARPVGRGALVVEVRGATHSRRRACTRRIVRRRPSTERGFRSRGRVVRCAIGVIPRPLDWRAEVVYCSRSPQRTRAAWPHAREWRVRLGGRVPRAFEISRVATVFRRVVSIRQA